MNPLQSILLLSLIQPAHLFMVIIANTYTDEPTWITVIKDTLDQIFSLSLNWEIPQARLGIQPDAINRGDTPFFLVKVKNEAGLEGDAPLQAALSCAHIVTSPVDRVKSSYVWPLSLSFTFVDVDFRIHGTHRTVPLFFTVSWVTFLKSESRRTQMAQTTIFCFLSGWAWASTLRKMSSVSLELSQPLDVSSLTSGCSTGLPCQPQAASHICSPRLYRSYPHRFRAIPDLHAPTLTVGRDCRNRRMKQHGSRAFTLPPWPDLAAPVRVR